MTVFVEVTGRPFPFRISWSCQDSRVIRHVHGTYCIPALGLVVRTAVFPRCGHVMVLGGRVMYLKRGCGWDW